jgi:hypothetical protein
MYNRLFTKILDSSIWLEADATRLVWITLLAAMDEDGFAAFSSVENLSRRANIPLDDTKRAVTILESPDKFNNDDEFEGRRIERIENGWMVLKAPVYRNLLTREIQREQTRLRVAKHREKRKDVTNAALQNVTGVSVTVSEHSIAEHKGTKVPFAPTQTIVWSRAEGFTGITKEIHQRWRIAYPACNIDRQLASMDEWLRANPKKAKKKNWHRFVTNWLEGKQERGGDAPSFRRAKEFDPNVSERERDRDDKMEKAQASVDAIVENMSKTQR